MNPLISCGREITPNLPEVVARIVALKAISGLRAGLRVSCAVQLAVSALGALWCRPIRFLIAKVPVGAALFQQNCSAEQESFAGKRGQFRKVLRAAQYEQAACMDPRASNIFDWGELALTIVS